MSIETICECYAKTNDPHKIKEILNLEKYIREHEGEYGALSRKIIKENADGLIFRIEGYSCYQYFYSIQPIIESLNLSDVVFSVFSDFDFSYMCEGVLGGGNFKKNIFSSKAKKQFDEIYESSIPIETIVDKIQSGKLKVSFT